MATKTTARSQRATRATISKRAPLGFPPQTESQRRYDEADLNRAIQAYRFFYPTVSGAAIFRGNADVGLVDNKVFGVLDSKPRHVGVHVQLRHAVRPDPARSQRRAVRRSSCRPGPLIVVAMDINQRWVADMGVPGPDAGKGGKHLLLPPDYRGEIPDGYHLWISTSNRLMVGVRSLPVDGDVDGAIARIRRHQGSPARAASRLVGAEMVGPDRHAAGHDAARVGGQHRVSGKFSTT